MDRLPFAISQSNIDMGKSIESSKRELSWAFGWTDSRSEHEVKFKYDNVSGKKVIIMDGKDVYNEINSNKGLSHCWETKKGHLFQIEHFDEDVVFSIDETRFEDFLFPRPIRSAEDLELLDASSDEEGDQNVDGDSSILSKLSSPLIPLYDDVKDTPYQYNFDIEVINPTILKNENYVTYTVNTSCDDPSLPQLRHVSVNRRYNDFAYLHNQLSDEKANRGLIIPPLPAKQTLGRFEPSFLEERRAALYLFLNRIRNHCKLRTSKHFISFLYQSEAQLLMEKKAFYHERNSDLRTSISDWFGSALHSLATTVGKYETVGLGFNPLDVQVNEIEQYIEPLTLSMSALETAAKNLAIERRKCGVVCSQWSRAIFKLGEMPFGPSTSEETSGLSLSQVLEMEPEPETDIEDVDYAHLQGPFEPDQYKRVNSYKFRSDISDITADDFTLDSRSGTVARSGVGDSGTGHHGFNGSHLSGSDCAKKSGNIQDQANDVPETLTTLAEAECSSCLKQLSCVAQNSADLLKDLAMAHEIEICRTINEYSRLLAVIKKTIKLRNDAKRTFTESIAVKLERYQQYNQAMDSFAGTEKIAVKLEAYNEAKRVMLENRQVHIQISKNLIADFHRFMISKQADMKKLAVDVLTFNLLNCQDNTDNWTNTLTAISEDIDVVDL